MLTKLKAILKEESGQSLVLFAVSLVALLGFTAIVIDVGYMYNQKSNLQTAADAAALAGALAAPKSTDTQVETIVMGMADSNLKQAATVKKPLVDRAKGIIEVEMTQGVPKFFANALTTKSFSLTVKAKAKFSSNWDGEALPFINLDDIYQPGAKIEAWEKTGPGDFESLWKDDFDIFYPNVAEKTYFKVKYKDGITVTKGVVANIKQEVANVYNQNKSVYLFSLSNKVINNKKYDSNLKNKFVIPLSDIVLLKVRINDYNEQAKRLILTVEDSYDIVNNDFPEDFIGIDSKITSKLIE
ncbi:hypothetical protein BABA_25391 [Neobacillus bataviensis LMG 21833]|uniref:Putative Flp pilus-assembly TadG-like N-terminal domain-containing protein n=1 Tax=Neobacillus bataviensis LMG 21833 TaxID=1117379 RepID=K6D2U7_9BACI|nr:pilus assembly protein TadG-related protein [Neobacillus bataviensis]EKN62544.1 hypothetical protein BABA_25391 [Neobacillus bataviensis LMG 21833]